MKDYVFMIRKELRGLKIVKAFTLICDAEYISSPATTYKAIDPDTFNAQSSQHRQIIRRAIRFLQTQGCLTNWDANEVCPESLVPADFPV